MRFYFASSLIALAAVAAAAPDARADDGAWYPRATIGASTDAPMPAPRPLTPAPPGERRMFSTKMFVAGLITAGAGGGLLALGAVNASSDVNAGANFQARTLGPALYVIGGTVIGTGVALSVIGAWPTTRSAADARLVMSPGFTGVVGTF